MEEMEKKLARAEQRFKKPDVTPIIYRP